MLHEVAPGVLVHESAFLQSQTTVVAGPSGVLLIDPGITRDELACLASDLRARDLQVVAGFSTHPDWDHVLWLESFGDAPRYATAAGAASLREFLTHPDWETELAEGLPPEHADEIPRELLGLLTPLPPGATRLPWDGPSIRILEHRAHAPGHAALVIEQARVLVAGDMLSDILMPFLDLRAAQPVDDYLAALELFDAVAEDVDVVVPGHGAIGTGAALRERIAQDRAYVEALAAAQEPADARIAGDGPMYWLADVHRYQADQLAQRQTGEDAP